MPTKYSDRLKADPAFRRKEVDRVSTQIITAMLQTAIAHGEIDVTGKTDAEVTKEFAGRLLQSLDGGSRLTFTIDHTASLRRLGKHFEAQDNPWVACVFYAMWVEHTLNWLVSVGVHRRGMNDAVVKQVIRDTSVGAKLSWIPQLLGFKALSAKHVDKLRQLAEHRNQFAHYKWTYNEIDHGSKSKSNLTKFLVDCRPSLQYLARYCTLQTLGGTANRTERLLALAKKTPNPSLERTSTGKALGPRGARA